MKKKIILLPHYLGGLKYLEKLIPHISNKYDIIFLFLPKIKEKKEKLTEEMKKYCQEKKYNFIELRKYNLNKNIKKIPFVYPLLSAQNLKKQTKKILTDKNIKKIISTGDSNIYYFYLFNEANKKNIDTLLLQWALTYKAPKVREQKFSIKKIYYKLLGIIVKRSLGLNSKKIQVLGGGLTKKFGVMNRMSYSFFIEQGITKEKMEIVGSFDFYAAEKVQKDIKINYLKQKEIIKKYNLNKNKKNIIIFTTPFNTKDLTFFSDQEQFEYYKKIVKKIREVFSAKKADILLKIHPAEKVKSYKPLEKYGVKIYDKNAKNEELIYFSDLYIAHHSTTNYIPIIMKKNAIFVNFANKDFINDTKKYFGIKKYISSYSEFKKLLNDFKNNNLTKQYKDNDSIITKDSLNKILSWIEK